MSWHLKRLCAFDLETTGVNVEEDRIVTGAVIGVGGDRPAEFGTWIANPGIPIPAEATALHHVTDEQVQAEGAPAPQVVDEIAARLAAHLDRGVPIVGHNLQYDMTLLDRECRRYDLPPLLDRCVDSVVWPVLDTRVIDQHVLPFRRRVSPTQGARQLVTLAQVYGLPWSETAAHGSEYDALVAARVLFRIGQIAHTPKAERPNVVLRASQERFDDLIPLDIEALHHAQIDWAAEQAAGLQRFFRKTDPAAVVCGEWPLIPYPDAAADVPPPRTPPGPEPAPTSHVDPAATPII